MGVVHALQNGHVTASRCRRRIGVGLPVGMMLSGVVGQEARLLELAYELEEHAHGHGSSMTRDYLLDETRSWERVPPASSRRLGPPTDLDRLVGFSGNAGCLPR